MAPLQKSTNFQTKGGRGQLLALFIPGGGEGGSPPTQAFQRIFGAPQAEKFFGYIVKFGKHTKSNDPPSFDPKFYPPPSPSGINNAR